MVSEETGELIFKWVPVAGGVALAAIIGVTVLPSVWPGTASDAAPAAPSPRGAAIEAAEPRTQAARAATVTIAETDTPTLLVVESAGCSWCRRFRNEVAPGYDQSGYGARAPLRYVQVGDVRSSGYQFAGEIRATPTFVLVDRRGKEIDRVRGYPGGGQRFYAALDRMLTKASD